MRPSIMLRSSMFMRTIQIHITTITNIPKTIPTKTNTKVKTAASLLMA
jgi:hypothetical protein